MVPGLFGKKRWGKRLIHSSRACKHPHRRPAGLSRSIEGKAHPTDVPLTGTGFSAELCRGLVSSEEGDDCIFPPPFVVVP